MPIPLDTFRDIARLGEPATVVALQIIVGVECACGAPGQIGLLNAQKAVCEACGQVVSAGKVTWEVGQRPKVELVLEAPSRRTQLSS